MKHDADVIIAGSGPGGIAAAWPLVEAGLRVLMVDPGEGARAPGPAGAFHALRTSNDAQWKDLLGLDFHALRPPEGPSPKFRVPGLAHVFAGFRDRNRIETRDFAAVGSLATGGLSNAWGAGVSCLSEEELRGIGFEPQVFRDSYRAVAARIGVSGSGEDALAAFHGADLPLQPPVKPGANARRLLSRYERIAPSLPGFRLGAARNAVLTAPLADRQACDLRGMCVLGCAARAVYSSAFDLDVLQSHANFAWRGGAWVDEVCSDEGGCRVLCTEMTSGKRFELRAGRVVLACGAIGTARVVLQSLGLRGHDVPLLANPMLAFAMLLPVRLGAAAAAQAFGLAQLSYKVSPEAAGGTLACGNVFGADGLRTADIAEHMPVSRPVAVRLFKWLAPAMLLANCYLPSDFGCHRLRMARNGELRITGGYDEELGPAAERLHGCLRRAFRRLGAWMLPGSFRLLAPGEDIHYAGTVPMVAAPSAHQAGFNGEVAGLPGVYVADGAALPRLTAKPLTLTIMANADRVAKGITG